MTTTFSDDAELVAEVAAVSSLHELAHVLRMLKRREARSRGAAPLTHREVARRLGCSAATVGNYLTGSILAPIDRFDAVVRLFGATAAERAALEAARDRVDDGRHTAQASAVDSAEADDVTAPRTLPLGPSDFVGRAEALAELDALLATDQGPVVISAVSGMGGVGKTALALQWAHLHAEQFPDGQLYLNLRGFDPAQPLESAEALGQLLVGLGVTPGEVPRDLDDRAQRYQEMLSGRRLLVLLDNADGAAQVRPLLPPSPCRALVTSRDRLDDLVALEGARRVALDVLTEAESVALLQRLVGSRCDDEPEAVRALVIHCGRLPLALRVAAELAASRPFDTMAQLLENLAGGQPAPDLLAFETGDVRSDVRAVFSWSLRSLPSEPAAAFRLLGLAPADGFDAYSLAALAGVTVDAADRSLAVLARSHLVQPAGDLRYAMHDLLRSYAYELAGQLDPATRRSATGRLFDYYLATATAAVQVRFPTQAGRARCYPELAQPIESPDVSTVESADEWLSAERSALVELAGQAAGRGYPSHGVALAVLLRPFFDNGYDRDGLAVYAAAFATLDQLGQAADPADRAGLATGLGITYMRLGRLADAAEQLEHAVAAHNAGSDPKGAVVSLGVLGMVRGTQGRLNESVECLRQSLEITRTHGLKVQEAVMAINLSNVYVLLGRHPEAMELCQWSIDVLPQLGVPNLLAHAYVVLARAQEGLGRLDEALASAAESFRVAGAFTTVETQADAREVMGSVCRRLGRVDESLAHLEEAVKLVRATGRRGATAQVLNTLGETHVHAGMPAAARDSCAEALELASRDGDQLQLARARLGLGDAYAALGERDVAEQHWREALEAFTRMGMPQAADAARRLQALEVR